MDLKRPGIQFLVEFPNSRTLMGTWCNSLGEAKDLADRYSDDGPVIFVHVPLYMVEHAMLKLVEAA